MIKSIGWFLNLVLPKCVVGICLAPFGIYIREGDETSRIICHEQIHWKQQMEMLILFFYLWYFIEWLIKLIPHGGQSYVNLSFEREAGAYHYDNSYLNTRKPYAWIKYIIQ